MNLAHTTEMGSVAEREAKGAFCIQPGHDLMKRCNGNSDSIEEMGREDADLEIKDRPVN